MTLHDETRVFISALAAFLIGIACLPDARRRRRSQVPNPVPRPQVVPNPKAALPAPAVVGRPPPRRPTPSTSLVAGEFTHGRVIVLRGLANVFSRGMDKLAKDLKALGVTVNLSEPFALADDLRQADRRLPGQSEGSRPDHPDRPLARRRRLDRHVQLAGPERRPGAAWSSSSTPSPRSTRSSAASRKCSTSTSPRATARR